MDVLLHLANLRGRDRFEARDKGRTTFKDEVVLIDEDSVFRDVVDVGGRREESTVRVLTENDGNASEKESFVERSSRGRVSSWHRTEC